MKYFIKTPITGWHEVDRERFENFITYLRKYSNPPDLSKNELVKKLTKIIK